MKQDPFSTIIIFWKVPNLKLTLKLDIQLSFWSPFLVLLFLVLHSQQTKHARFLTLSFLSKLCVCCVGKKVSLFVLASPKLRGTCLCFLCVMIKSTRHHPCLSLNSYLVKQLLAERTRNINSHFHVLLMINIISCCVMSIWTIRAASHVCYACIPYIKTCC